MYIIEKRRGIYEIFSDDRIHIGSTTKYADIRHMVDDYHYKKRINEKRKSSLYWYYRICDRYGIRIC